jgi:hypothetical protein
MMTGQCGIEQDLPVHKGTVERMNKAPKFPDHRNSLRLISLITSKKFPVHPAREFFRKLLMSAMVLNQVDAH